MRGEVRPRAPLLGWANQPSARLQKRGGDGGPVIAGAEEEGGDRLEPAILMETKRCGRIGMPLGHGRDTSNTPLC